MYMEYMMKTTINIAIFSLLLAGCVFGSYAETAHTVPTKRIAGTSDLVYYKNHNNLNFYRIGISPDSNSSCNEQNEYKIINPVDVTIRNADGTQKQILVVPRYNDDLVQH